jgi:hypothetical protein
MLGLQREGFAVSNRYTAHEGFTDDELIAMALNGDDALAVELAQRFEMEIGNGELIEERDKEVDLLQEKMGEIEAKLETAEDDLFDAKERIKELEAEIDEFNNVLSRRA